MIEVPSFERFIVEHRVCLELAMFLTLDNNFKASLVVFCRSASVYKSDGIRVGAKVEAKAETSVKMGV